MNLFVWGARPSCESLLVCGYRVCHEHEAGSAGEMGKKCAGGESRRSREAPDNPEGDSETV